MKVTLFKRNPRPGNFSMEGLLSTIEKHFPSNLNYTTFISKHYSSGLIQRIRLGLDSQKNQGDVNHITGDIHFLAFFLKGRKTLLTVHDCRIPENLNFVKRHLYVWFWFYWPVRLVKRVSVISESTKNDLIKMTGVNPNKVLIIHNPLSKTFKKQFKEFNSKRPLILQIGTKENKIIERLAQALEGIQCELLVVGKLSSAQMHKLDQYNLNYTSYFNLTKIELINLYIKADIVSFLSIIEGFGMPILEAQAIGRVLITSNVSAMPEIAGDGACFANPYDISDMRKAFKKVMVNDLYRSKLIENGFKNILRFDPEKIANKYAQVYKEIYQKN